MIIHTLKFEGHSGVGISQSLKSLKCKFKYYNSPPSPSSHSSVAVSQAPEA